MAERVHRGGCLCGAIRFEAAAPAERPHTCSCELCRRHSGALTLAWAEFPAAAVAWTGPGGPPALFRSSDISSRAFCPVCGSTIGAVDDAPTIALALGAFDDADAPDLVADAHSFVDGRPPWWRVGGDGS